MSDIEGGAGGAAKRWRGGGERARSSPWPASGRPGWRLDAAARRRRGRRDEASALGAETERLSGRGRRPPGGACVAQRPTGRELDAFEGLARPRR